MKKKLQRVLAGFVAAGLCMSMISVTAFADDETSFTNDEETTSYVIPMSAELIDKNVEEISGPTVNEDGTVTESESGSATLGVEGNKYDVLYDEKTTTAESSYTDEDGNTVDETYSHTDWTYSGEGTVEEQDEKTDDSEESDGDSSGSNAVITGDGYEDSTEKIVTASDGDLVSETGVVDGGQDIVIISSETSSEESTGDYGEDLELTGGDGTVYSDEDLSEASVTITVTPDSDKEVLGYLNVDVQQYVDNAKAAAKAQTNIEKDENGNITEATIVTVKETVDSDTGEVNGYTQTKTEITATGSETTTPLKIPDTGTKTETDPETGYKTTVTVTKVEDSYGNEIGYKTETSVADATGFVIYTREETVTDKIETSYYTIETTTTERVYNVPALIYFTVTMSQVEAGENQGTGSISPTLTPDVTEPAEGQTDTETDLYNRPNKTGYTYDENSEYLYQWLGAYGLESAIRVNKEGSYGTKGDTGSTYQAKQFVLVGPDEKQYYVYCADFEVEPQQGYGYTMENVQDADYYKDALGDNSAAEHIQAIASVGYWGTKSGTGSLEQLKDTLNKAIESGELTTLTKEQVNQITDGMALTATQAAIWTFGTSGELINKDDIVGLYNIGNGSKYTTWPETNAEEKEITQKLYEYLITLTEEPEASKTIPLINENSITSASITVNSVKTNDEGEILTNDDEKILYDTEVSFILAVQPDNDTLKVTINTGSGEAQTYDLDDTENVSYKDNEDGTRTYTIKNVTLADGTKIDVTLTGTQEISGVYLFTSERRDNQSSQTFVGLASGKYNFDLTFDLTFNAETKATYNETETTNTLQVIKIDEDWTNEWKIEYFEKPDDPGEPDKPDKPTDPNKPENPNKPDEPEIPEIPFVPTTPSTPAQPEAPATGTTEVATQPETTTTTETAETAEGQPAAEAVISDVPMTGDESHMAAYLVLAMLSGAALIGLGATGKKKNEEV